MIKPRLWMGMILIGIGGILTLIAGESGGGLTIENDVAKEFGVAVPKMSTEAPFFSLRNLSGKRTTLTDYRGQILLLHFSTTW